MAKKVAVLVVNPVNGLGLFEYLEAFFENGIPYQTFAVGNTADVKTNSGISLQTDDVVANLVGHEDEFDALVFACGDAMPTFAQNVEQQYNQDMLGVMKSFADKGKIMAGHCGAALLYDSVGATDGKKVALHPFIKSYVKKSIATDDKFVVDGKFFTAQSENTLATMIPQLLDALK